MKSALWFCPLLLGLLTACPSSPPTPPAADMAVASPDLAGAPIVVARRPSRSSTIAIADDDSVVVMSNPDDRSVSIFDAQSGARTAKLTTGDEPWAVALHPDSKTAFVAHRAAGNVVKLTGVNTATPAVAAQVAVGAEPTGLALSPTGAKLFVAEWAESRVSIIDTRTMTVVKTLTDVRSPRALAVTNNGDSSDDDETLVVPEFYGDPQPGGEGKDNGRTGVVRLYSVRDGSSLGTVTLGSLTDVEAGFGVGATPNQLGAVAIAGRLAYITSVSASPQGPPKFDNNISPVVYVVNLDTRAEVRTATTGTVSLAREVQKAFAGSSAAPLFLADLRDVEFVPGTSIAYFVSQGADAVQRVAFSDAAAIQEFGSTQNKQIDVLGAAPSVCQAPSGIAIARGSQRAFLNCWVSRKLAVVDLGGQKLASVVESAPAPADATGQAVQRGKRFYFTARGRWSNSGWSSCGSCHPDGLSDNMTWIFAAGPRQTTSMDGTFSHGPGAQKQRALNWTAIFDELHDFEGNTRGVSGGLGAVTTAAAQSDCGTLAKETRVGIDGSATLPAGLGAPTVRELQDGLGLPAGVRCVTDWNDIEAFVKTIRPPQGRRGLDAASVARGAQLFATAGACVRCHGGPGWTISTRFYQPSTTVNTTLAAKVFTAPAAFTAFAAPNPFQVSAQPVAAEVAGFNATVIAPPQLSCALRNVKTFGVPGDDAATNALEIKAAGVSPANRAQGRGGYNVPSLYGLSLGAPYLHHGQAKTLSDLFTDDKWRIHYQAGAANFLTGPSAATDRADLINFLLSLDATTPEQAVPAGFGDGCSM